MGHRRMAGYSSTQVNLLINHEVTNNHLEEHTHLEEETLGFSLGKKQLLNILLPSPKKNRDGGAGPAIEVVSLVRIKIF